MDYLTVKEAAELKGCSERYIKKLCKDGNIQAEVKPHPQNKQPCYMIPVSALPEELKTKYYKQLKAEARTAPELKEIGSLKPSKNVIKKAFEEYSAEERAEIAL